MPDAPRSLLPMRSQALVGVLVVLAIMTTWVLLAPRERLLGDGIRTVYLHVATSWAGLTSIHAAGFLGIVACLVPRASVPTWGGWGRSVAWVGIGLFTLGFLLSLVAAWDNWGGILWTEPRTATSLRVIVFGLVAQGLYGLGLGGRWRSLLWTLLAVYAAWSMRVTELFFHPERPIQESTSTAIQATFYGLYALALLLAFLAVVSILPRVAVPGRRR